MRPTILLLLLAACVELAPGTDRRDGGLAADDGSLAADEGFAQDEGERAEAGARPETGVEDAMDAGTAEVGPARDEAGIAGDAGDEAALYPEVVGTCPRGWSSVFHDPFDGPLTAWETSPAAWRTEGGELVVDLMQRAEYWSLHLVRRSTSVEQLWARVDMSSPAVDAWPQLHLRVSAAFPEERFFSVRLRGDLAGIELVRQSMPANETDPDAERIFDVNLAFDRLHRVVATAWTLPDGRVRVAAGIYDARMDPPRFKPDSFIEHTYPANEAYGAGTVALSGWVGVARFDEAALYACD